MERRSNVKPPQPGIPARGADVTGIYRSMHQGLLQLRADGSLVLILPGGPSPSAGTFTLEAGRMRVRSDACGAQEGSYDAIVTGEQKAGEALLRLTTVDDECADRRYYLTLEPWIYANS